MTSGNNTTALPGPHAPPVSRWKSWLGPFYFTGSFWSRLATWGATRLPEWLKRFFHAIILWTMCLTLRRVRRVVASNLEVVLGPCSWLERERRIYRVFSNFGWTFVESFEQYYPGFAYQAEMTGLDQILPWLDENKGFIFVSSHIGNWDSASGMPGLKKGKTVHLVREREMNPYMQAQLEKLVSNGNKVITHFTGDDATLGPALLHALREGSIVSLQGDRPRTGGRSTECTIFGRPWHMPPGPAALARAAEAPLVPVFIFRAGRLHYQAVVRPPIHVERTGDRDRDLQTALDRMACELEWAIRQKPYQWYCFAPLWEKIS